MALTATATKAQRQAITSSLEMKKEFFVTVPPDEPNIMYHVAPFETLDTTFGPIADQLLTLGISTPRCLIFCQKLNDCPLLYRFFRTHLGTKFTFPPGSEDKCGQRLVDMYHSCTEASIKEKIHSLFWSPSSYLRLLIATVTFGMGVDIPSIRTIIHFGACEDV